MHDREEDEIQARGFRVTRAEGGAARAIVGQVASIDVLLEREGGRALVSLAWPSCGLGLRVRRKTFRDAFRRNSLLPPELVGTLFAEARSPVRAAVLLAAPIFPKFGADHATLDDRSLHFTQHARERLVPLLDDVISLAGRLEKALHALPLPPLFAAHEQAWTAAAHAVGGHLERGTASIVDFTVGGYPATIRSVWTADDDFQETLLAVGVHEIRLPRPLASPLLLLPKLEELLCLERVTPEGAPYR
jgi:hypothetical protein